MPITEKNLLPLLAVALVGGVSTFFAPSESKKCDKQCKKASNFKSQLGEVVQNNIDWQAATAFFDANEELIKTRALAINQSIGDASGAMIYDDAAALLQSLVDSSLVPGLRILVALQDGRVTFDSAAVPGTNTFANAQANEINPENHNTRPAIMSAQLTCDGNGNEVKFSVTTGQLEAYNARRILPAYGANGGTVRVSKAVQLLGL
jgi:hypothetical protein